MSKKGTKISLAEFNESLGVSTSISALPSGSRGAAYVHLLVHPN